MDRADNVGGVDLYKATTSDIVNDPYEISLKPFKDGTVEIFFKFPASNSEIKLMEIKTEE